MPRLGTVRGLVGLVGLVGFVVATAGCGSSARPAAAVGALAAPPPTLPASPWAATGGPSTTTTVPNIGGVPVADASLRSGAPPARSPWLVLRGTTWPARTKASPSPVRLAPGGYEADIYVSREHDYHTGGRYPCSVTIGLVTPSRSTVFRAPPQSSGVTARTFVVTGPSTAKVLASGPVGCDWVLMVHPA